MKEKRKSPAGFLLIIPAVILLDIAVLAVTMELDIHRLPTEPKLPMPSTLPFATLAALYYLAGPNVLAVTASVILTIVSAVNKKNEQQKGEDDENDQHSH